MATGMRTTYTDTTAQKRVISDMIKMIDPRDIPLINALGLNNETKFRFVNAPGTKYEWLEDSLSATSDQLNEALDSSETGIDVDDGTVFHVGDVIQVDDEYMWVSSISSNTLTVTRGHGGTTAASHDDDTAVYIRYNARLEGADSDAGHTTSVNAPYNYSLIMHEEVIVSGTDQIINYYGIDDQYKYHLMKKMGGLNGGGGKKGEAGEMMIDLERVAFYGKRLQGTASTPRSAGGLDVFITTNVNALSGTPALTQKVIEDKIQDAWSYGGKPNLLVCNAWAKRKISSFYAGMIRTERREDMGGMVISSIETEFGELDLLLDRHCPSNKLYILDKERCGWITLRPFKHEELAKTGDWKKGQVVGEYGFVVTNQTAHAIISGFSTTK